MVASRVAIVSTRRATEYLERFLSKAGVLSRTEAQLRISRGDVTVNGQKALDPRLVVQPAKDEIEVRGTPAIGRVTLPNWKERPPLLVLYNKPQDVVVTMRRDDPGLNGRKSLAEALPKPWQDRLAPHAPCLKPVGRLDAQSAGLLLMTDCGKLADAIMAPGSCSKEYLLRVQPAPGVAELEELRSGLNINDGNWQRGRTKPCEVAVVGDDRADSAVLRFTIQEGRNRQLRRMCEAVSLDVLWLLRIRVGPLLLGRLGLGEAREATAEEFEALLEATRRGRTIEKLRTT